MTEEDNRLNIILIIISSLLLIIASTILKGNKILYIISYLIVGVEIIIKALKNLLKGHIIEENFLMTIATIGAILIGEYTEAVAVMLLYQIGELIEDYASDNTRKQIKNLMDIKPEYANVLNNNKWEKKKPEEVKIKDIVLIKPGEKVPLDGKITKGETLLDMKALTGESLPKKVHVGDNILNGCINQNKAIEIEVSNTYKESTVSKILNLVENANNKKATKEKFITKFAKIYTPIVVLLALLLAIIPPLITNQSWHSWIYKSLSFLVVSCPCALVISVPLSFFVGIGLSAKNGILVKGSNHLEDLSKVSTCIFDKTGTLTEGVFKPQKIESINVEEKEITKYASYAEYYSNHPIAKCIKDTYQHKIDKTKIKEFEELPGLGIKAKIEDKTILIGNDKLMEKYHITYHKVKETGTILYIAINNTYEGYMILDDKIKENTKTAIKKLQENYQIKTMMLTGDIEEIAESISKKLNIDKYYASLLPNNKVEIINKLKKETINNIIFVGDGINDAPALVTADIGIAMGGIGSDAAIEAADIVIMTDNLPKIITALEIAKKTLKIAKENIFLAITIKLIILLLTVIGITSMWLAVFADVGVSILAIGNSLRLLKYKDKEENL